MLRRRKRPSIGDPRLLNTIGLYSPSIVSCRRRISLNRAVQASPRSGPFRVLSSVLSFQAFAGRWGRYDAAGRGQGQERSDLLSHPSDALPRAAPGTHRAAAAAWPPPGVRGGNLDIEPAHIAVLQSAVEDDADNGSVAFAQPLRLTQIRAVDLASCARSRGLSAPALRACPLSRGRSAWISLSKRCHDDVSSPAKSDAEVRVPERKAGQ